MTRAIKKDKQKNVGGRPRKFRDPSRPITITLPERTLKLLAGVDSDRARAVVKAADWISQAGQDVDRIVDIVDVGEGKAIILVGPSRCLKQIPFLQLIEVAPARFLLILPTGTSAETLELAVKDIVEDLSEEEEYERKLLSELSSCLSTQRRSMSVSKAELLLIDTAA